MSVVRVSDNHSWTDPKKNRAERWVSKKEYGVWLQGDDICPFPFPGRKSEQTTRISKRRYNTIKNIRKGTILYMADNVGKNVYKGIVKSEPKYKYYNSSNINEYLIETDNDLRTKAKSKKDFNDVVMNGMAFVKWDVDWTLISDLNDEWRVKLNPSDWTCTAFPLII